MAKKEEAIKGDPLSPSVAIPALAESLGEADHSFRISSRMVDMVLNTGLPTATRLDILRDLLVQAHQQGFQGGITSASEKSASQLAETVQKLSLASQDMLATKLGELSRELSRSSQELLASRLESAHHEAEEKQRVRLVELNQLRLAMREYDVLGRLSHLRGLLEMELQHLYFFHQDAGTSKIPSCAAYHVKYCKAPVASFDKAALLQHLAADKCDIRGLGPFQLIDTAGAVTCNKHSVRDALRGLYALLSSVASHVRYKPATGELIIPATATFGDAYRLAAASFFEFVQYKVTLDDS